MGSVVAGWIHFSLNLLKLKVQSIGMRTRFDLLILTACNVGVSDATGFDGLELLRISRSNSEKFLSIS